MRQSRILLLVAAVFNVLIESCHSKLTETREVPGDALDKRGDQTVYSRPYPPSSWMTKYEHVGALGVLLGVWRWDESTWTAIGFKNSMIPVDYTGPVTEDDFKIWRTIKNKWMPNTCMIVLIWILTLYSMLYTARCLLPVVLPRKKPNAMRCEQNQYIYGQGQIWKRTNQVKQNGMK